MTEAFSLPNRSATITSQTFPLEEAPITLQPELWPASEGAPLKLPDSSELSEPESHNEGWSPKWPATETAFLELVRQVCSEQLTAAPYYRDAYGERRLLRFLRHYKQVHLALEALQKYMAWRRDNGIDDIRKALAADPQMSQPNHWPHGAKLLKRFCVLPCSIQLFDRRGNALCVERYGMLPAIHLRDISSQDYLRWQMYCLEWKCMQLERISIARERTLLEAACFKRHRLKPGWGEIARLCTIFDLRGVTFSHALLPNSFKLVKTLIPIMQAYYPWLQDLTHLVNASKPMYAMWKMIKPLLPQHTQDKIHIHSADAASLAHFITPCQLPDQLGGNAPCPALSLPSNVGVERPSTQIEQSRILESHAEPESKPPTPREQHIDDTSPCLDASASDYSAAQSQTHHPPVSPQTRLVLNRLDAGAPIVVYKHGRRGRSRRFLTCNNGIIALSQSKGLRRRFFLRSMQRVIARGSGGVFLACGGDARQLYTLEPWQLKVARHASTLPSNYAVLGTVDKIVTLEFVSVDEALALSLRLVANSQFSLGDR